MRHHWSKAVMAMANPQTDMMMLDSFRRALYLDGWEQQSIWGWDEMTESLFAQLWRNGDRNDEPTIWITGSRRWPATDSPGVLARYIASATGCSEHDVLLAMADQAPGALKAALLQMAAA